MMFQRHRGGFKKKELKQHPQQRTQTQANEALAENARYFSYPPAGFVSPIEHSLLYSMIRESSIYPPEAIRQAIEEQDFTEFLQIRHDHSSNKKNKDDDPYHESTQFCSYAQLSALLSLAMHKWPPHVEDNNTSSHSTEKQPTNTEPESSIPQFLSRRLLRTIVEYATEHDLDRQHEIDEFLQPAIQRTRARMDQAANRKLNAPFYAGVALSIATANPLPMYLAYTAGTMSFLQDDSLKEGANLQKVAERSQRTANVETASLMDEMG